MWITPCQDCKMDKTVSFLFFMTKAFKRAIILLYFILMEKLRKMKKGKRANKHGFLKRSSSHGGQKVLKKRRQAKRKKLTVG